MNREGPILTSNRHAISNSSTTQANEGPKTGHLKRMDHEFSSTLQADEGPKRDTQNDAGHEFSCPPYSVLPQLPGFLHLIDTKTKNFPGVVQQQDASLIRRKRECDSPRRDQMEGEVEGIPPPSRKRMAPENRVWGSRPPPSATEATADGLPTCLENREPERVGSSILPASSKIHGEVVPAGSGCASGTREAPKGVREFESPPLLHKL